jgi:hypothetical protein
LYSLLHYGLEMWPDFLKNREQGGCNHLVR